MVSRFTRILKKRHPPVGAMPGTLVFGDEAIEPRIQAMSYDADGLREHVDLSLDDMPELLSGRQTVWVDVRGLGDEAFMRHLAEVFKVHPLALEDMVNVPQRPKMEPHEHHLLIITRMMRMLDDGAVDREQVSLIVGENYVLSVQERFGDAFDPVRERLRGGGAAIRSSGPEYLGWALLDAVIDAYYPVLESFGEHVGHLEDEIVLGDTPSSDSVGDIHHAKRELLAIRRALWPQREMISRLMRSDRHFVGENLMVHLGDCYDHCVQLMDVIETYRELCGGLMDAYMSVVANRQNEVMKTLTIMASIFIPLSFLAGVYGMNFEYMPETKWHWAYPVLLVVMALLAGGMLWIFRARGWLGQNGKSPRHKQDESSGS